MTRHDTPVAQARRILGAVADGTQIAPFSDGDPTFGLDAAFRIADAVMDARQAAGASVVGWKIGFTNRNIWDEYGVHAPIWGAMYDTSVRRVEAVDDCSLAGLVEPRIEPEIALRLCKIPQPGMDERALMDCIDAVTHGFEIVQSIFPGWKFQAADTMAAFAMHGRFLHGPLVSVEGARDDWFARLSVFRIELAKNDMVIDSGQATDVLGGPLSALRHMVDGMALRGLSRGLEIGDLITTGTVTRAFPIAPGERWTSHVSGLDVAGMDVRFFA